ncbi:unnamed protein product, partial [Allacma fusca]
MEDYHGYFPNDKLHGSGGPLHIGAPAYVVVEDVWIAAGQEVGLTLNDPNGYQNE